MPQGFATIGVRRTTRGTVLGSYLRWQSPHYQSSPEQSPLFPYPPDAMPGLFNRQE